MAVEIRQQRGALCLGEVSERDVDPLILLARGQVCNHVAQHSRVQGQDLAVAQDRCAVVKDQEHVCIFHELLRHTGQGQLLGMLHA